MSSRSQTTGTVSGANAYRNPYIPSIDTNALTVQAASLGLLPVVATSVAQGHYLNAATAQEPVAVLGAAAAQRLGIDRIYPGERIWVGGHWFYVAGTLKPAVLAPAIDSSVLVGYPAAEKYLGFDGHPSTVYLRAQNDQVNAVDNLLAATANPENPSEVNVSQPSSALVAQADAKSALNGLFLGLGAVALLVGAVGVANIMIISVLERRSEIGLRRALGATKGHIRTQFLSEAVLLGLLGGVVALRSALCPRRRTPTPKAGPPSCHQKPGSAASPPPWSSARSPGSCPPCVPPGCHPLKRCGACEPWRFHRSWTRQARWQGSESSGRGRFIHPAIPRIHRGGGLAAAGTGCVLTMQRQRPDRGVRVGRQQESERPEGAQGSVAAWAAT